jgi:diaminopimelate epimerase
MSAAMPGREFIKMHGLRNHFVIVDARREPYVPTVEEIVFICDPQVGVGADQLIVIEAHRREDTHAFMRILNTDGREVEACGNATRCVAWLLLEELAMDTVVIETVAGLLRCERAGDRRVRCEMGRASMEWQRIPLDRERDTLHLGLDSGPLHDPVAVNVGNSHAVFFVTDLDAVDMRTHAPAIQRDPVFPRQINVGAAQLIDAGRMRLTVYERGAGLTMACGTGACAAVYAARARGLTNARRMQVELPGGTVDIEICEDDLAVMTGPAAFCFSGRLPPDIPGTA